MGKLFCNNCSKYRPKFPFGVSGEVHIFLTRFDPFPTKPTLKIHMNVWFGFATAQSCWINSTGDITWMIPSLRWRENQVLWTFIHRTWDSVRLMLKYNQRMLVVEELACGNIHILDSSGAGLVTTGCQIKRRCIQFPISVTYCPNFPELCTSLIKLVNSYCSLFQAHSNPACLILRLLISTFLSSFSSLAGSPNCLAYIYGCLDICFFQGKRGLLKYYHSPRESCSNLS